MLGSVVQTNWLEQMDEVQVEIEGLGIDELRDFPGKLFQDVGGRRMACASAGTLDRLKGTLEQNGLEFTHHLRRRRYCG